MIDIEDIQEAGKTALKLATGVDLDYKPPQKADERILLDDYQIPGTSIKIRANKPLGSKDVSGQTSQTASVEVGTKAFSLTVSCIIADSDGESLETLTDLVNGQDDKGKRKIYQITNTLANRMKVSQVRFDDNFSVVQDNSLGVWNVSFTLKEFDSVSAKLEALADEASPADAVAQAIAGKLTDNALKTGDEVTEIVYKGFEKFLKKMDDLLADDEDES